LAGHLALLEHCSARLQELTAHPLDQAPIALLRRAAQDLSEIQRQTNELGRLLAPDFEARASAFGLGQRYQQVADELRAVCQQCDTDDAVTFATFNKAVSRWLDGFTAFEDELRTAEFTHKERAELRAELEDIEVTMRSRWFGGFAESWQRTREQVEQGLREGLSAAEVREKLAPFTAIWQDLDLALSEIAGRYGFLLSEDLRSLFRQEENLAIRLSSARAWLDESIRTRFGVSPAEQLPPLSDLSWPSPAIDFALAIEMHLLDLRMLSTPPDEVLRGLSALAERRFPETAVCLTEAEVATVGSLAERCGTSVSFLPALNWAGQLLSEGQKGALKPVIRRTVRSPLWRLPESIITAGTFRAEIELIAQVASEEPAEIPLANRLHIEKHCDHDGKGRDALQPWSELLDLGPFGAWLFAGWLAKSDEPLTETLIRTLYCKPGTEEIRWELAFPLAAIRKPGDLDLGAWFMFAALELLAQSSGPAEFQSIWRAVSAGRNRYPKLCERLARIADQRLTSPDVPLSSGIDARRGRLSLLETQMRSAIHPRKYRNIKSFEQVGAWFLREKAHPMQQQALTAVDEEDCTELLNEIASLMEDLERDLDQRLDQYAHTQHFPRPNFHRDCREMLKAVEEYLTVKREYLATEGRISGREDVAAELDAVAELGWMASEAAKVLRAFLVERTPPPVPIPGNTDLLPPGAWLFCHSVQAWRDAKCSIEEYSLALDEDIGFDNPYDGAVALVRNMEADLGRQILANLPDLTKEDRFEFEHEVADIAKLLLGELADQRAKTELTTDEVQLAAEIEAEIQQEEFQLAFKHLIELGEKLSAPDRNVLRRRATAHDLSHSINEHLEALKRAAAEAGNPDNLIDLIVELRTLSRGIPTDEELSAHSDEAVRELCEHWSGRRDAIRHLFPSQPSVHLDTPPEPAAAPSETKTEVVAHSPDQQSPEVVPRVLAPAEETPEPSLPLLQPGEHCFGIVKRLAGYHYAGYVTPFHSATLNAKGDLYFRKTAYEGDIWSLEVGDLVEILADKANKGYDQPEATRLRKCSDDRREEVRHVLEHLVGQVDDDIGVIARVGAYRMVISELQGACRLTAEGLVPDIGTLVRFRQRRLGDKGVAEVLETIAPVVVGERRAKILGRIAFAPSTSLPVPPPSPVVEIGETQLSEPLLLSLDPQVPATVRVVRELRRQIDDEGLDEEVVRFIEAQSARGNPNASWLRAVFVPSQFRVAGQDARPGSILEPLVTRQQDWWRGNVDVYCHDLFSCLREEVLRAAAGNGILGWESVYDLFRRLQENLGPTPHFRLEVILARVAHEQMLDALAASERSEAGDFFRRALKHADNARILNPRLSEASDLQKQIREAFPEKRVISDVPSPAVDWSSPPADALEQIRFFRSFYEGPDATPPLAERLYRSWRTVAQGLARGELCLLHARLLRLRKPGEALNLLCQHALQDNVVNWQATLEALFDTLRLTPTSFEQIERFTPQFETRIPADQRYRLHVLLARSAEEAGNWKEVENHASLALYSKPNEPSAQLLLERSRQQLKRMERPGVPAPSSSDLAERLWRQVYESILESRFQLDILLPYMKDEEVGAHVLKRVILEKDAFRLDRVAKESLLRVCRQAAGDITAPDLFYANVECRAEEFPEFEGEAAPSAGRTRIEAFVTDDLAREVLTRAPDASQIEELQRRLTNSGPFCALACFWVLAELYPQEKLLRRYIASYSASAAKRDQDISPSTRSALNRIFFESMLACWRELSEIDSRKLAERFDEQGWHGLATAVRLCDSAAGEALSVTDVIGRARIRHHEWPKLVCVAKTGVEEDWPTAANAAILALLIEPHSWWCCQAFHEVFSSALSRGLFGLAEKIHSLAQAVIDFLSRSSLALGPELVVLGAQFHFEKLKVTESLRLTDVLDKCKAECQRADQIAGAAFQPGWEWHSDTRRQPRYRIGDWIGGRYQVVEDTVGRGGFGWVYKAKTEDGRMVAVKVLKGYFEALDQQKASRHVEALRAEAAFQRNLLHPNIAAFVSYQEYPPALVLEWIEGRTIDDMIRDKVVRNWREVALIARQLTGAMQHACKVARDHYSPDRDFAHRDIHSANVMLSDTPSQIDAKLLDFGLARLEKGVISWLTDEANPEMVFRDPLWAEGGTAGDIFSLGVVLHYLLRQADARSEGGRHPYPEEVYKQFRSAKERDFEAMQSLYIPPADGPEQFRSILAKMVKVNVNQRYRNWDDLAADFSSLVLDTE
jgi:hypothetical protein